MCMILEFVPTSKHNHMENIIEFSGMNIIYILTHISKNSIQCKSRQSREMPARFTIAPPFTPRTSFTNFITTNYSDDSRINFAHFVTWNNYCRCLS